MSIDLAAYETKTREAVKAFWGNRAARGSSKSRAAPPIRENGPA